MKINKLGTSILLLLLAVCILGVTPATAVLLICLGATAGSMLVAAKVDAEHPWGPAKIINSHPGVSHNYKRNHAYNLWYTIAVPPGESLEDHIDVLHRESGALVRMHDLRNGPTLPVLGISTKGLGDRGLDVAQGGLVLAPVGLVLLDLAGQGDLFQPV